MERFATTVPALHVSGGDHRTTVTMPLARPVIVRMRVTDRPWLCSVCRRLVGRELCTSCARSLALGLAPLRTRELGAEQLVREVRL